MEQSLLARGQNMMMHNQFAAAKGQGNCRFWISSSLQAGTAGGNSSELELLEILEKSGETPTTTYLGVSPPVRSGCYGGAANPWSHDRSWKSSAYSASHSNLEALRELDQEGESFLKCEPCTADLVLGSPRLVSSHAQVESSDAGSDAPSATECTPFTCHTAYFDV